MEIFKDIEDYEGLYRVSNYGTVESLTNKFKPIKTPTIGKNGYPYLFLWKNNKSKAHYIHRLVATYFIENPDKKNYINHKNSIKTDFSLENLEWVSGLENSHHSTSKRNKRSSKYVGVFAHSGKWESACWFNNKKTYIGRFDTEEEAHKAHIDFLTKHKLLNKYALTA